MVRKQSVEKSKHSRPIMVLFDVLGKRWTLRILWELRSGHLNFRELRQRCDDVSPTLLNQRLKTLRQLEIVDHQPGGYGLTTWGKELGEQLIVLNGWAENWARGTTE